MTERYATVDVTFSIDGIVGRETYHDVLVIDRRQPLIRAWAALEMDLIDAGLAAWECHCCLRPDSGVKLLGLVERTAT